MNILFVCLGNICRSPTAEAILRHKFATGGIDWIDVDSAGTAAYHIGNPPDPRSIAAGECRGYDLSKLKARQLSTHDFYKFDHILAMDIENLTNIEKLRPTDATAKVNLAMAYTSFDISEVPDPYYGNDQGFVNVIDLCESIADGFIASISEK